ncbi:ROK family transcriptional regulator (plasmid) [Agrobacterium tumefaciens]|uniref:ROK family transcriptional regulator n=1 Tax=Agrobacterium tumefaciens TaxID=358 RepID=A0AAP9EAA0_AGRTU|nr:ROK family transcriptional regulator [Agrobacterium tumefaciens]NSZ60089.1 ROK family transcriptional regulator [Agrobacterium tumefaciens]QDY97687.2 ROK family transcriptional regulator [Agrobacterium tumefaciens]UXS12810.1 ROK family transcriptional regulator [Agrobacterium tumefaciens]UXS20172.1 ROK family transcriptional regulator [Agrobacterium tumefaciens]UXS27819.1 ROK family transcriptional regulator [Agrobacterium tumefaciens]
MSLSQLRLRTAVLDTLSANGAQSRADVARRVGASRSTISLIIGSMIAEGLVQEVESAGSGGKAAGRPSTQIALASPEGFYIGVDFGRIFIKAAISDANYSIIEQISADFDIDMPAEVAMDLAAEKVNEIIERSGVDRAKIKAVGIGVPGPVDASTGHLHAGSILARWVGTDVPGGLSRRLDLPVYMDNDANLGALAESVYGAARQSSVALYVLLSVGVGLGIAFNGQVFRGASGIAGELGHVVVDEHGDVCRCGSRGCLEAIISVNSLAKSLSASHGAISSDEMLRLAVKGDIGANRVIADAGHLAGRSVGALCSYFNPEIVIVGGELMRAGDSLLTPLKEAMKRFSIARATENVRVVPAALGEQAELIGTLLYAAERHRQAAVSASISGETGS